MDGCKLRSNALKEWSAYDLKCKRDKIKTVGEKFENYLTIAALRNTDQRPKMSIVLSSRIVMSVNYDPIV